MNSNDDFLSRGTAEEIPENNPACSEDDIPLLTEILSTLPDLVDSTQNETAWEELEQRLAERILKRVEERIKFVLEEIIQQNLAASVQKMTGTLVSEIQKDLQSTLDVVVTHAVTDELHRLRKKESFSENNHFKITEKNEPETSGRTENQ